MYLHITHATLAFKQITKPTPIKNLRIYLRRFYQTSKHFTIIKEVMRHPFMLSGKNYFTTNATFLRISREELPTENV
ncbi:hypothetical protein LX69_01891 [Breznakibacter xylanolyticus]|uniref:Uncharacterized protein n=1 Tax=Breznakibacter xylanolyticus TaxID=990 RepID=A0A2W7NSX1_9BACT|nr:hypothetical protein LX69_01891 [Breznakibacter xylanolyticus]